MRRETYNWQLPPEIELRLGDSTYGKQRAIYEARHLLLILHAPPSDEAHRREFQVFLRTPDGKYLCNGRERGETQLRHLMASYQQLYEQYDQAYDDAHSAEAYFRILEPLAPIARAAANLHGALQSARQLVPEDKFLIAMRDEAYEVSRSLELLLSDAKTGLDYHMARNAEAQALRAQEMATAQHKLNVLAAITFPLMAMATIFGMNLAHGMEDLHPVWFWGIFAAGLAVGMMTRGWVTNRNDKPT